MNKVILDIYLNTIRPRKGNESIFFEKDIEEIVFGNVPERDKFRETYLENEFEKELNKALNKY